MTDLTIEYMCTHPCILSHSSRVRLFETPWTVACQASLHGILQARILQWVAISYSRASSPPSDNLHLLSPELAGGFLPLVPPEAPSTL